MQRKLLLPAHVLVRYGMDLTNSESLGPGHAVRSVGVFLTLALAFLFVFCNLRLACYRRYETLKLQDPNCDFTPPGLGPVEVNRTYVDLEVLDANEFPEVFWGGQYFPHDCIARDIVAIIVPYKDNKQQLPIFLNHMHQFLMKQKIDYQIFIIEQAGHEYYNRGKLLNVGFVESQRRRAGRWQCFVFHDIDLLPLDTRNLYSCPDQQHPRHLAAAVEKRHFQLPYLSRFDGVSAMTVKQFTDVNGYSNTYWGWDGESDDMAFRMHAVGYTISRYNMSIARYASLERKKTPSNKKIKYEWYNAVMEAKTVLPKEGLSTLNYTIQRVIPHRLYTRIVVHLGHSPNYQQLLKILKKYYRLTKKSEGVNRKENLDQVIEEFAAII